MLELLRSSALRVALTFAFATIVATTAITVTIIADSRFLFL